MANESKRRIKNKQTGSVRIRWLGAYLSRESQARHRDLLGATSRWLCYLTDGNLNRHLHHLEEAEIVHLEKRFEGNRPQTLCKITKAGLKRFTTYLDQLQKALEDARPNPASATAKGTSKSGRLRPSAEGF